METQVKPGTRCQHYHGMSRCERDAVGQLHAPDGVPVPGCWYCERHAIETIEEYAEKLHESWTIGGAR